MIDRCCRHPLDAYQDTDSTTGQADHDATLRCPSQGVMTGLGRSGVGIGYDA